MLNRSLWPSRDSLRLLLDNHSMAEYILNLNSLRQQLAASSSAVQFEVRLERRAHQPAALAAQHLHLPHQQQQQPAAAPQQGASLISSVMGGLQGGSVLQRLQQLEDSTGQQTPWQQHQAAMAANAAANNMQPVLPQAQVLLPAGLQAVVQQVLPSTIYAACIHGHLLMPAVEVHVSCLHAFEERNASWAFWCSDSSSSYLMGKIVMMMC